VSFLVAAANRKDRIGRTLRRVFPDVSTAGGTRFELVKETAPRTTVRELFRSGRAAGTLLLWASFFFAFMILVTNSSWSPILLRRVGIAPEQTALALGALQFRLFVRFGRGRHAAQPIWRDARCFRQPSRSARWLMRRSGWSAPSLNAVMMAEASSGCCLAARVRV